MANNQLDYVHTYVYQALFSYNHNTICSDSQCPILLIFKFPAVILILKLLVVLIQCNSAHTYVRTVYTKIREKLTVKKISLVMYTTKIKCIKYFYQIIFDSCTDAYVFHVMDEMVVVYLV